jgi:hypothetical protein
MKEFFDRCYYPLLGRIEGRPYATAIAAGSDGRGAQAQIDRIVTGWRLRRVAEPLIVNLGAQSPEAILAEKTVPPTALALCGELGAAMGEGLRVGVFWGLVTSRRGGNVFKRRLSIDLNSGISNVNGRSGQFVLSARVFERRWRAQLTGMGKRGKLQVPSSLFLAWFFDCVRKTGFIFPLVRGKEIKIRRYIKLLDVKFWLYV